MLPTLGHMPPRPFGNISAFVCEAGWVTRERQANRKHYLVCPFYLHTYLAYCGLDRQDWSTSSGASPVPTRSTPLAPTMKGRSWLRTSHIFISEGHKCLFWCLGSPRPAKHPLKENKAIWWSASPHHNPGSILWEALFVDHSTPSSPLLPFK